MRSAMRLCLVLSIVIPFCWGCAGSKDLLSSIPATINTVKPAKDLAKKIAVALTYAPASAMSGRSGEIYLNALINAMRKEGPRLQVTSSLDADWPDGMTELLQGSALPGNVLELAGQVRRQGYNAWACARIENIWPVARKSGILWFRKKRYFLFLQLTFTIYDPISGAKIFDDVVETKTKIAEDDYNRLKSEQAADIESLYATIEDIAADLGEQAADALNQQPWETGVARVDGRRIYLAAGGRAGLHIGDRLAVFEGRRRLEGKEGARFVLPGYKIAEIEIVDVGDPGVEARDLTSDQDTKIQAGDIAVAIQ